MEPESSHIHVFLTPTKLKTDNAQNSFHFGLKVAYLHTYVPTTMRIYTDCTKQLPCQSAPIRTSITKTLRLNN